MPIIGSDQNCRQPFTENIPNNIFCSLSFNSICIQREKYQTTPFNFIENISPVEQLLRLNQSFWQARAHLKKKKKNC